MDLGGPRGNPQLEIAYMITFDFGKICRTKISKPSPLELLVLVVVLVFVYLAIVTLVH